MNFKELLEKYQDGQCSKEDEVYVEGEISKFEALEEYSSKHLDEEFLSSSQSMGEDYYHKETSDLKRSVNHRLRKVITISVLIATGIWIGVFYGLSPLMDNLFYSPMEVSVGELDNDISFDVQAITELNMPGMNSSTIFAEGKGFGSYDVSYSYIDTFSREFYEVNHNIVRGEISSTHKDPIFRTDFFMNARYLDLSSETMAEANEKTLAYIKELNPLSYGSFGILFQKDLTMEELRALEERYANIEFQWAAMRTGDNDEQLMDKIGIGLLGGRLMSPLTGDEKIREEYPAFSLMSWLVDPVGKEEDTPLEVTGYELHYRNLLEYVIQREEIIHLLEQRDKGEFYRTALAYANENGVKTYGVVLYGEMRDVIDFIENEELKLFDLTDALVTRRY